MYASAATRAAWYEESQAARFGIASREAEAMAAAAVTACLPGAGLRQRDALRRRLHVRDLMLARACAAGHEEAWREFWHHYRARLQSAARALTRDRAAGDDLADELWAELFGLPREGGRRVSKLDSYMGLGSLEGWLRTLLAQAHVNRWRQARHEVSLEACTGLQQRLAAPTDEPAADGRVQSELEAALRSVLTATPAALRLLLSLYFLDGNTLAQIAALQRVHQSTISRRLDRAVAHLRRATRRELGRRGLRPAAVEAAFRLDPLELRLDVRAALQAPARRSHGF
ncbi:MAG: RNA polymerase sigma factor [Terriglobales bacterium]